jgi:hypothetical protein
MAHQYLFGAKHYLTINVLQFSILSCIDNMTSVDVYWRMKKQEADGLFQLKLHCCIN